MEHNFESNFFTMLELLDPTGRLEVEGVCTKLSVQPDEIIYKQGDPSTSVYIVASGRVEAFTHSPDGKQTLTVGFVGKGEFFGDLGILTNHPRLASVRSCEPTKLLQIEKLAFVRLLEKVPKMGAYFARNLARRLHATSTEAYLNIYSLDLGGNLRHFDLVTIFQAITSSKRNGHLELHEANNELIGSFFFRAGNLEHARFAHLAGAEAVWHGFAQETASGAFFLRIAETPSPEFNDETKVQIPGADLVRMGTACRDAYNAFPEPLRLMQGRLNRLGETLVWTDAQTLELAERIWELIAKRPQPLESAWRRLNISSLRFLQTVSALVSTGQADILIDEPTEEKAAEEKPGFGVKPA